VRLEQAEKQEDKEKQVLEALAGLEATLALKV
jgi:hypothetical protein